MSETTVLPKTRIVHVAFEFALPQVAALEDIDEWVRFSLGSGSCSGDNPLLEHDLESLNPPILTDTEKHIHREFKALGEGRYNVKTSRINRPSDSPSFSEFAAAEYRKDR